MRKFFLSILALAALVASGAYAFRGNGAGPGSAASVPARPTPVTASRVADKELPIYRAGLGTVQAFNTVTVKVRVDGEIQKIAFREGQDVREGDLLAQIDPRPYEAALRQSEADLARDQALLENAKLDLERVTALGRNQFASRQSVDTQTSLVTQYQAAIRRDQALIDNARVQLGYTTITSPLTGRTGLRLIDQGNIVRAGDVGGLVVITQLHPISVIFTLPQQYLPEIAEATRGEPPLVLAYDQDNRVKLAEGRLELIDNQIDQGTGSVRIKAVFPNEDNRLWPGLFVNAWLRLDLRRGSVVPEQAVQAGPDGSYAFVVRPDSTVEARPVRLLARYGGEALVSGLSPGDRIVIDGQSKLRPGARVAPSEPKPNTDKLKTAERDEASR
jgi:multidrug efflux system membrane fusion protein